MSKEESELAFPYEIKNTSENPVTVCGHKVKPGFCYSHPGMTLRDYFAAKAMQGILANPAQLDNVNNDAANWVATDAYKVADAMLKARGQ